MVHFAIFILPVLSHHVPACPQLKRQVLLFEPGAAKPAEWNEHTLYCTIGLG